MTDFEAWLRKGLGRAAMILKKRDSRYYRGPLLHACTHNLTYDPQCEDGRAPYLLDLIKMSGEPDFYRHCVLTALLSDDEDQDLGQLFELGAHFASNGDGEMKRVMYAAFERHGFVEAGLGSAEQLVVLDGVNGLLFAAKSFGDVEADERPWQFGHLIEALKEHHGEQMLPPELKPYFQEWQNQEKLWESARQKGPEPRPDYATLKRSMTRVSPIGWARSASSDELALVVDDFLVETDEKRIVWLLRAFRFRAFPGPLDRLLALAKGENDKIARAALTALSNITDERVRELGLSFIQQRLRLDFAAGLLIKNSAPGDLRLLENLLADPHDADVYHHLGIDVRNFIGANRSEEAERSLLLLYEHGPCSTCRHGAIEELIAINRLPDWMIEECRYDADGDTRKLAMTVLAA